MITLKNVKTLAGKIEEISIKSAVEQTIDAQGRLTALPGLIDPHVSFPTSGATPQENWISGAQSAVWGGITTVFDVPDNEPACIDQLSLKAKKALIDAQLATAGIPLNYYLFSGAEKSHLETLGQLKGETVGVKIFRNDSSNSLAVLDPNDIERAFQLAAQTNMVVAIEAEEKDKTILERALLLTEKFKGQLYISSVSTLEELAQIRKAKKNQVLVYAETSPQYLFLNDDLRLQKDQNALWEALHDGTIDTIGSSRGLTGVETTLPLLLNAVNEKRLKIDEIVKLMRLNPEAIFNIPRTHDVVLVDLELKKEVKNAQLKSTTGRSPYAGTLLQGWPMYTILKDRLFKVG